MDVLQGLLSESVCKRPVQVRSEPITDHYTVEARPFARGKFATVRRCRHRVSGVEFAAKYMRKRRRASDVRHEILHEAHVLELSQRHPHIVRLHEVYETPSEIILVLELVPGGELQRVLDDEEVVPEREAARLLRQILAGVSFLHHHKIAHLDLKPQNLLLTKPFPEGEVKLCDFGISRLITKGIEIREIVGTPDYVAPEVLHYEPISLPTDMWSIGILTYVLLSGHSPFGGDSKQETFCNITRGTLDFPNDLFANVSNNAKDFIQRLLVRNPRERMSAEESLSHPWLIDGEPILQGIQLTLSPGNASNKPHLEETSPSSPRLLGHLSPTLAPRISHFRKSPSPLHNSDQKEHNNGIFSRSLSPKPNDIGTSDPIAESVDNKIFRKSLSPKPNGSGEPTARNIFRKSPSPLCNGTGAIDQKEQMNGFFQKNLSPKPNGTSDPNSRSVDNGIFCKSSSPKPTGVNDQKEQKGGNARSVDMMVAQFEGISMSKRIVFSEEIIVDERVGMVY